MFSEFTYFVLRYRHKIHLCVLLRKLTALFSATQLRCLTKFQMCNILLANTATSFHVAKINAFSWTVCSLPEFPLWSSACLKIRLTGSFLGIHKTDLKLFQIEILWGLYHLCRSVVLKMQMCQTVLQDYKCISETLIHSLTNICSARGFLSHLVPTHFIYFM